MKIVLAGSPKLVVSTFKKIIENFEVIAIVTNQDKPKGRGLKLQQTPVAELGEQNNIQTFKVNKVSEIYDDLKNLNYDLFISFAFGQYVPEKVLKLGNYIPLNIHGSLLPKYRGAAPIHYAILNGDHEIGISLMKMTKEMDAGPYLFQAKEKINQNTTYYDALKIIENLANQNIVDWLSKFEKNDYQLVYQNFDEVSFSPKLKKEDGYLDSNLAISSALRIVKAFNGFTSAYFLDQNNTRVKVFDATRKEMPNSLKLKLKDGTLFITEYQFASKKRVKI